MPSTMATIVDAVMSLTVLTIAPWNCEVTSWPDFQAMPKSHCPTTQPPTPASHLK